MTPMQKTVEPIGEVRWRLAGGTLVHRAAAATSGDGIFVILACDKSLLRWRAYSEVERLGLRKPSDAPVTCARCKRRPFDAVISRTPTDSDMEDEG